MSLVVRRWSMLLIGLLAAGAASPLTAAREDRVVVSASAEPHYRRDAAGQSAPRPETYTFAEGRSFAGRGLSRSLTDTPFLVIARTLARDLAKQHYLPAPEPEKADLLLMVHWGITQVYEAEDPVQAVDRLNQALGDVRAAVAAEALPEVGTLNEQLADERSNHTLQSQAVAQNARLLGYNVALAGEAAHPFGSELERTLRADLSEERYFVIVMAYDYRALRETKRKEVLWVARLSVPARGKGFAEALPALSRAGGEFFGQSHSTLQRVRTTIGDRRRGVTELGELQVIGEDVPAPRD